MPGLMKMEGTRILVLYIIIYILLGVNCQDDGPVRQTTYGAVRGAYRTDQSDREYEDYRSIPFAAPPVGPLRFEKSVPPEPWEDVKDVTEFGPHCVQIVAVAYPILGMTNETSEDCLSLDVYVPGRDREGDNLAVMVWIYGGAFVLGTSQMYPGYDLALRGDVIVVAINYRFGSIGFLSTEDDVAPGNYGLWDIALALQWVQDNAAAFGGDTSRITVFGQSAGGALTSHMMISPYTNDLFQRGLAISGGSSGFFGCALPGAIAESTQTLARTVGCRRLNGSAEVIQCLREVDANELDFWGLVGTVTFRQQLPNFIPRVDGDFVPVDPAEAWRSGEASHLDFLTGSTMHDASFAVLLQLGYSENSTRNLAGSHELLNTSLRFLTNPYPGDPDEMKWSIFDAYPLMEDDDVEIRTEASINSMTDWWFQEPAHFEASQHASSSGNGNTFHYRYRYDNSFLSYQYDFVEGSHLDDVSSVLGEPFLEEFREDVLGLSYNDEDRLVNDYVASYYVNFANSGDPNQGLSVPSTWPQYDSESRNYMELSLEPTVLTETEEDDLQYYRYWRDEFPLVSNPPPEETDTEKIRSIEDYSEEELQQALEYGIDLVTDFIGEVLSDYPDQVEAFYDVVQEAMENRERRLAMEE